MPPALKIYLLEDDVRVGEIYVPDRSDNTTPYEEHWVLYQKYKYPGPQYLRGLAIKADPSEHPYASADDFFRRVRWTNRSKYIHITATESPVLQPVR